jgi:uncharacterized protein (TIGR02145 family)
MLFPLFGFSQAPQKINFQSILRNTNGEVVANKSVSLKISILSGSITGTSVYSETHTKTTDASGLISLQIGSGSVSSGVFNNIDWGNAAHFIKLEADFSGGSNYVVLGTQELMSVPYALYAGKTDTNVLNLTNRLASKLNISDFPLGTTTGNMQYWNGTTWINLAPGLPGQVISMSSTGIPSWSGAAYPTLTTSSVSAITPTTANGGGNISSDGGAAVSARGLVYGTSSNPTLANAVLTMGSGTGSFSGTISGLTPNTTYYIRAYATNSTGTGYGNQQTFTSSATSNTLPVVTSTSITGLTTIQATFNAEVNSQGGGTVTERGAVWNTSGNPTVNSNRVPSGSGTGVYTTTLTGLSAGSNYYVRAYAINNFGISYGIELSFTTLTGLATLTTSNVIAQSTTASSGGNITDNGGSTITARGMVWNTTGTPTVSDNKTTDGSGTGSYVSSLTGLSPSTTYYVRAYATNSTGTAYGNQQTFTTTATSTTVTDIDGNTYNTVQIGTQVWMSENLKTSRYRNGGSIPYVVGNTEWQALTTGAWSYYNHDEANNAVYGKLYNWYTVKGDTLCPSGWHVPTDAEWTTLTTFLGSDAGGKMKETGTTLWKSPNTGADNSSGFSARPGGYRYSDGSFYSSRNYVSVCPSTSFIPSENG